MPRTIRDSVIHPISIRELEVRRVVDITDGLRRVTLTGEQLGAFERDGFEQPPLRSSGFDDDIKLFFPYPGESEPVLPVQKDGTVEFGKDPRPLSKNYTVRRWDAGSAELDVDFVKHGTGVATTWAYRCNVGDTVHIAGPIRSAALPTGIDWLLVVGDDTAVPAIARLLEELPAGARAQVFIEIAEAAHEIELKTDAEAQVTWLHRDGAEAGTTTALLDAVRRATWWPGDVYAWVAGETLSIKPIRRYLKDERQVPSANVEVTGYWRQAEVVTLEDDPAVPDPEKADEDAFERLHEMGEMLPPFALRAAVTLGLPELISSGTTEVTALAAASGADPVAVGKLLRYLQALDVVTRTPEGQVGLTDVGELMTDEFIVDVLDLNGPIARQELGFIGLLDAVRTGRSSFGTQFGVEFSQLRADAEFEASLLEVTAKQAQFVAPALASDDSLSGARHVVVHSRGSGVIARAIAVERADTHVSVVGLPSHIAYLRDDLDASIRDAALRSRIDLVEQSVFEQSPAADAVLLVLELDQYPDADASRVLAQASARLEPGGRLLVMEHPLDEVDLDDHAAEEDLKNLVLFGTGHRTDAENRALFEASGLELAEVRTVGWGFTLYVLGARA